MFTFIKQIYVNYKKVFILQKILSKESYLEATKKEIKN